MSFMSEGSLYDRIFSFLGKMIALNLLWMVCALPVITAGASTTALFYCTLKLHKEGDISPFRDFFKSFRQNLVQSTVIWMVMLLTGAAVYLAKSSCTSMPGALAQFGSYGILACGIPLVLTALYIFPTVAAFENKTMILAKTAFYFAVKHIGFALAVAVITILPMTMTLVDAGLFPVYLFIWLLLGFSLTAYADSWFIWKLFKPCFPETETGDEYVTEETPAINLNERTNQ